MNLGAEGMIGLTMNDRRRLARRIENKQHIERNTRAKRENYENVRRAANKLLRQKKRKYSAVELKKIEHNIANNITRQAYKVVKSLGPGYQFKTTICKSKNGGG